VCVGNQSYSYLGEGVPPFCNGSVNTCTSNPLGLIYVTSAKCTNSNDLCVQGDLSICSNAILPYTSYYWVGTAPLCIGAPGDCGDDTYILSNICGDGDECLTGHKVLCGRS